ncbi:MAG: hypothetical protein AB7D39_15000 [Pseudodesulfovibrio sp.]|uniref:dCTP deaminase domain-containing protein n=1 Tax=Pseudodesulfovibrio sp. TaxID=2035812 RepID=UPI003D140101
MFWGSKKLIRKIEEGNIIRPFTADNVESGAYELTMGDAYYSTDCDTRQSLRNNDQFKISPGQFALLETREVIRVPLGAIGLISIKAKIKFKGLVNVSGFHVDPGYEGKLVFSVYNAGGNDIYLSRQKPIFLIWFCDIDQEERDGYRGNSNHGITDEMVEDIGKRIASPSALNKRLSNLEFKFKVASTALLIGITIVIGWVTLLVGNLGDKIKQLVELLTQ